MPILEAGISIHSPLAGSQRNISAGFTILEILVVVAVLAISATTILLNANFSRPERALADHSQRLSKTMRLLYQEAILNDRNFALSIQPGQYLVLDFDGQGWVPSQEKFFAELLKPHEFSDEITIDRQLLVIEKQPEPQPHILILSSGETTPFEWDISDRDNQLHVSIKGNLLGDLLVEGPALAEM